ncbi:Mobile element protein [Lutibaculum baratangense AMV1]|uniref:Mobile element protein n=1 Tax=Lutibaculum baratangense AMV1 TaxID=631454 RepID=V4QZP1_9HYPH|nr:Mobile element protein [Lutibaculum baratangense AMV1]
MENVMWTPTARRHHNRRRLRHGSDLTDAEWASVEPFLPPPSRTGRPRRWPMREIVDAIFYVLRSGCPWHMVPDCFPPASTVYRMVHAAARRRRLRDDEPPPHDARPRANRP